MNQKLEITDNKVNFLIGSNESGKSNILNGIKFLDRDGKYSLGDKFRTRISGTSRDNITLIGFSWNSKNYNYLDEENNHVYKIKNTPIYLEYKKIISRNLKKIKQQYENINITPELFKLLKNEILSPNEMNSVLQEKGLNDSFKEELIKVYENIYIHFPVVYYVEPVQKTLETKKITYLISDLKDKKGLIYYIWKEFGSIDELENFLKMSKNLDVNEISNIKKIMLRTVNNNIREYFSNFKFIGGYPWLAIEGKYIVLNIMDKNRYSIDHFDENYRSAGFKCFSRILLEAASLANTNNKMIYMVDEPEQALHPLLQKELLTNLNSILKNNTHLTIIFATHSPYFISGEYKNINLIYRNEDRTSPYYGETIIEPFSFENSDYLISYLDKDKHFSSECSYLYKILLDSIGLVNYNDMLSSNIQKYLNNERVGSFSKLSKKSKAKIIAKYVQDFNNEETSSHYYELLKRKR